MTKDEFKQREALYKHLMKLKVPEVLAELIAVRTELTSVNERYEWAAGFIFWGLPEWAETPEGKDFWSEVYKSVDENAGARELQ